MKRAGVASCCVSCILLAVAGPLVAQAGAPMGAEFRVNTHTTSDQENPRVASDSSGNFVVVWVSYTQDDSKNDVFGQRYTSSGAPAGAEFLINTYTTSRQVGPSVTSDPSGNFVVVWQSDTQDGSSQGVFGQRYASSGAPAGAEFQVNTQTASYQARPSVAADASGRFVVVWMSAAQDGATFGILGQRYASSGAPLGVEFQVNTDTMNAGEFPKVASDSSGNFVVVWAAQDGSGYGVLGRRYASSGTPAGAEFRVNTYTTNQQISPSVASDPSGNFVVVWASFTQDGSGTAVIGQRYASSGGPLGPEFQVASYTTNSQWSQNVAVDASGNFVVVWMSDSQDGDDYGVFGQRFASSGAPVGAEFRVNSYTTSIQDQPAVASDSSGNFVVVWESRQDGSGYGVFGQRYGRIADDPLSLSLSQGRVQVTVDWKSQYSGQSGAAFATPQQDGYGFFYFTDPNNPEVFVKVLDFGQGGALCFVGGLTDFYFKVTFRTVRTGQTLVFEKPAGAYVGFADNGTLRFGRPGRPLRSGISSNANTADAASVLAGILPLGEAASARASTSRAADPQNLDLSQGRVQVVVEWRSQYSGQSGTAFAIPQQDGFGFFYFTDPGNPEVFVKVLDFGQGGALCFVGGLSDFFYKVTFKTLRTGQTLVFEKPAGLYVGFADNGTLRF